MRFGQQCWNFHEDLLDVNVLLALATLDTPCT